MWSDSVQADYDSLLAGTAIAALDDHFVISLTGEDRHSFLHNFCTADIKKLTAGNCCEAFVLNGKGKTMVFVHVLAFDDVMWLIGADKTAAQTLMEHLDKYIIREDVQLADLTGTIKVCFAPADTAREKFGLPAGDLNQCMMVEGEVAYRAATIEVAGFGLLLAVERTQAESFERQLAGIEVSVVSDSEPLNSIRLEQATPWSGAEADESNLPQELQRDEKAISFNKGCYLGQETVARLDALGRVNQLLVRVQLGSESPSAAAELTAEEKVVGRITSVAWSPKYQQWIGFAFVRRAQASAGTVLQIAGGGTATVFA